MGNLVKCRSCGKDVDKFANKCPGCGAQGTGYALIYLGSFALACLLVWHYWLRFFW